MLQPLTEKSRRKLQSTENFDVKSLFTSIPLQLALQCTETAIQQSTVELPLPAEDIMDLLNLCLTSTYFQYNGKHYKQVHGTAMESSVSVVLAETVLQHVEGRALATCRQTIPLWLRDTLTALLPPFTKTKLTLFTTTLTNRTPTSSLPKTSKKMENFLF